VIKVKRGGRDGEFVGIAPVSNIDSSGVERADIHAMAVRRK
jgi:hypothetical protein